jgi:hypothetical protein
MSRPRFHIRRHRALPLQPCRDQRLGERRPAHVALPYVRRVASLVKRWLLGTHQGGISRDQLDFYLDEFTFRYNRRHSKSRGLLFYRVLEQAVAAEPTPYRSLVA